MILVFLLVMGNGSGSCVGGSSVPGVGCGADGDSSGPWGWFWWHSAALAFRRSRTCLPLAPLAPLAPHALQGPYN